MSDFTYRSVGASETPGETLRDLAGEAVWDDLVRQSYERWHAPGELLLQQGEPGTLVLAVLRGVAKVVRTSRSGAPTLLAFRGPGELLGEVAVRGGGVRLASVETLTRCKVAVMMAPDFTRFVDEQGLSPVLERYALARLRESTQARGGGDVLHRLAVTLVKFADISRSRELAVTHDELAQHLRVSRNTISRFLRELESCQVWARRKRIVIDDLPALRRVAHSDGG
ncbi:Crp/Fnr family transcriptional regulator [Streptomyces hygroscopicus]|uniref:Crp/Fnr family transcriptional regulator n=1 Tax=Streptomyces hygroscopicus TaxID=1912 RepID=UPI00068C8997|nr:Crp/Fnr family transcriptional regulator [Streptomyces hygroscopicus]